MRMKHRQNAGFLGNADLSVPSENLIIMVWVKRIPQTNSINLRLCAIDPPSPSGKLLNYLSGKEVIKHV